MNKKKQRKIITASVVVVLVLLLVVGLVIYSNSKSGVFQFALNDSDLLSFNRFIENEERSDNSLLEYGKVLNKYGSKYEKYTGEDITINASNFYGVSYVDASGETVYVYRTADAQGNYNGGFTSVVYRGKSYTYNDVVNQKLSFATAEFVEKFNDKLSSLYFDTDYEYVKKVDNTKSRDENGYTTAVSSADRYDTLNEKVEADENAVKTTDGEALTFIYNVSSLVKETALYSLDVEYFLPSNRQNSALIQLRVDNKYPFKEAASIELKRTYNYYDINGLDIGGNEIRCQQQEIFKFSTTELENPEGLYRNPYRFLIQDGSLASAEKPRTISLTLSREPAVIRTITIKAPSANDSYEEYKAINNFSENNIVTDAKFEYQFEIPDETNSMSLRSEWDGNYATVPASYSVTRYNYFGGDRWASGGDSATWSFSVDKDGWYQIGFRYETTLTDIVAFREIKIDGTIPFDAMEEYCFPYSNGWHAMSLVDENQNPYYFYLTAGTHTIELKSKVGPLRSAVTSLTEAMDSISDLITTIVSITGAERSSGGGYTVDKNRDWDLDKYIVGIQDEIDGYRDLFQEMYDKVIEANGGTVPFYASSIASAKRLFTRLSKDLEDVPSSLNDITDTMSSLSTTLTNITEQPLAIDYMIVSGGNYDYSKCKSTTLQDLKVATIQFKDSFVKDYSVLGSREEIADDEAKEIEVYIGRGREYVEILKNLIAEDFTPKTGIKVKVNMVAGGVEGLVMLRYVTGTAPDVAMSVGTGSQVDYACRGALAALNDLDGDGVDDNPEFYEYMSNFAQNAFVLSRYRGNYYSLPETQVWAALFYRTDIMDELNLSVPNTWNDVYELLPTLQENGMDFYYGYSVGNIYPFIYQLGGSLYDTNGMQSALLSDEAYSAFVEYSDLYNKYNLAYAANFYMKFKMGDMPLGLADMSFYCQLKYSAPEINGKWKIACIPGHAKADGTIDRSIGGSVSCCVLINNKGEARQTEEGWEFLKWWMSTNTQVAYAQEVEATFGVASRWSTANVEAIKSMAYSDDEIEVILDQWSYFMESPNVLGGYYTSRYLNTALNQAVLQGDNIRIALEDAVREINKEMKRKQDEFFPEGVDSIIFKEKMEEGYKG